MGDIFSTFPFFKLPGEALSNVVRCMDLPEILCLSLISYKSQQLVKSLNIDSQISSIHVTDEVVIALYDFHHFYFVWDYDYPENLIIVKRILDENDDKELESEEVMTLTAEGFNLGHWMSHLQSILIEPEIQVVTLYSIPAPVDAQWFFNSITGSGIKYLAIHESFSVKECRPLLPFVKELEMCNGPSKVMTSSFPLLNLPPESILHVLKSMDYGEFIAISLLSERAKQAVESMNLYCREASAVISNQISLVMDFDGTRVELRFTVDKERENQENGSLELPDKMELSISTSRSIEKWIGKGSCIKRWITHFNAGFHFSKFDCLQFDENASLFDIKELQIMFYSYDQLCILSDNGSDVKSILKHFPTRRLSFDNDVFTNLENPHPVLIQNYDELEIDPLFESPNTLQLDDLLIINSKTIEIYNMNWAVKELNRFLKHWIKGSNPRLERLAIHFFSLKVTNLFEILNGIKYVEMPAEHTRWFKSCKGFEAVREGHDFNRCDGTKATIIIPAYTTHMVEMYVWYPHCVGEVEEMEN